MCTDNVTVRFFNLSDEQLNCLIMKIIIAVNEHYIISRCLIKTFIPCNRNARILLIIILYSAVSYGIFFYDFRAFVVASVIYTNNLKTFICLRKNAF